MLRVIVLDANIIIEFERIKRGSRCFKYRGMNEESKLRIFGYRRVEFIFVSNDRRALEVAGDLEIRII